MPDRPSCGFCGKRADEVAHLVSGPAAAPHICDECVGLCAGILAGEAAADGGSGLFAFVPREARGEGGITDAHGGHVVVLTRTDDGFVAYSPDLPECRGAAADGAQALDTARRALHHRIADLRADGEVVPARTEAVVIAVQE
jgi:predicted RNase H-like HicB family nuclease